MASTWAPCLALSCLLGLGSGISGGLPAASAQDAPPTPVVIDSDMISDDWMATLYVLNNPQFDVQAITVTGAGFADCEAGVRAALGILALAGHSDVPVSCGSEDPLVGSNAPPADWMTTIETVEALGLPEGGEAAEEDAVALFTSTIEAAETPVTVLALGPLTNVASALEAAPELVDRIEMIVIMGGAVDVDGSFVSDANTTAEWNIYSDPHAARLVFESGVPITLVPLDATNEVPVTPEFVATLEAEKATPAAEFVATLLGNNAESIASGSYYFWDPLAAVVLGDPGVVTFTPRDVVVIDTPGEAEDGRTKADPAGTEILVATAPDAAALEAALLEAWNR